MGFDSPNRNENKIIDLYGQMNFYPQHYDQLKNPVLNAPKKA